MFKKNTLNEIRKFPRRFCILHLAEFVSIIIFAATILPFLKIFFWRFEQFTHFKVQYIIILIPLTIFFCLLKRWKTAILSAIFLIINIIPVLLLYTGSSPEGTDKKPVKAIFLNVLGTNTNYSRTIDFIEKEMPDFFIVCEINQNWDRAIKKRLQKKYPYNGGEVREDFYGISIMSRLPIKKTKIHVFVPETGPSIESVLFYDNMKFTVIGTHVFPPSFRKAAKLAEKQFAGMGDYIHTIEGEIIVMGDLNTSSWSQNFKKFLKKSGLKDSRKGFGINSSYPASMPEILRIPIDHALISNRIKVKSRSTGPDVGSDHLPLIIEFLL
jgi:endonuclease/exonuclease/phosphatase (EEP) superfamily protein YafD